MPAGGPRPNSGPKGKPKKTAAQATQAQLDALTDQILADLPEYYATIRELAKGIKVGMKPGSSGRKPGAKVGTAVDEAGEEWDVYLVRPDANLLHKLLEHVAGRPGQKEIERPDPVIVLRHQVPRPQKPGEDTLGGIGLPELG